MTPKPLTPEQVEQAYLIFEQLEAGRVVLQDLTDSFAGPSFNPNHPDPLTTAYHEGRRAVVTYITDTLAKLNS